MNGKKDFLQNRTTFVSVITRSELLGWKLIAAEDEIMIKEFILDSTVFSLEESIIERTILLRKSIKIKLPDAIIAATALEYNMKLLSHNIRDFINIPDLIVVDANTL